MKKIVSLLFSALLTACGADAPSSGTALLVLQGVSLGEGPFDRTSTLSAEVVGEIPAKASLEYAWFLNNARLADQTQASLQGGFVRGDAVRVEVRAVVGDAAGEPVSAEVDIGNAKPTGSHVVLNPAQVFTASKITAVPEGGADADGDPVSWKYLWYVDNLPVAANDLPELQGDHFEKGDRVRLEAIPFDGETEGQPLTAAVTILNSPPAVTEVSIAPGVYRVDSEVAVSSTWTDADGDLPAYQYAWFVAGLLVEDATAAILEAGHYAKGQTVQVSVTPFDGEAVGTPVLSNVITIQNSAPTFASVALNGIPYAANNLSISASGWYDPDGDAAQYNYAWYVNGALISSATGNSLSASEYAAGATVYVYVTAFDGTSHGTSRSVTATILNMPPEAPVAAAMASPVTDAVPVFAGVATPSYDYDGDTVTYKYTWARNGITQGYSEDFTGSASGLPDGSWSVTITPNDGFSDGATATVAFEVRPAAKAIALGGYYDPGYINQSRGFGCALSYGGGVWCWGDNDFGQVGNSNAGSPTTPVRVEGLQDIDAIAAGWRFACAADEAGVYCWGANDAGQLGNGQINSLATLYRAPIPVSGITEPVIQLAASNLSACALTAAKEVYCWGNGVTAPTLVAVNDVTEISGGVATNNHPGAICARTGTGALYCWGSNGSGQLGVGYSSATYESLPLATYASGVTHVDAGGSHTCALVEGALKCWGNNYYGQLGTGDFTYYNSPRDVSSMGSGVREVAAGAEHTCAVKDNGTVWCWGNDFYGQSGQAMYNNTKYTTPVQVTQLSDAVGIDAGITHSCAIVRSGGIVCWAYNFHLALGTNTNGYGIMLFESVTGFPAP